MKVSFSLIILSLMLATCHACYEVGFDYMFPAGKEVVPNTCVDLYDGRKHLFGSRWIADDCFQCDCDKEGMHCCHRYMKDIPGCKAVMNSMTCEYEYYTNDDPSQRCEV